MNEEHDLRLLMPDVRADLTGAIGRATTARPADTRRIKTLRAPAIALAALAMSGTAIAATSAWNPFGDGRADHPSVDTRPIPADQLAVLGALRRPQTDADRSAAIVDELRHLHSLDASGVRLDGVRVIALSKDGPATFLMPVAKVGGQAAGGADEQRDVVCLVFGIPAHIAAGIQIGASSGYHCGTSADIRAGRLISGALYGGHLQLAGVVPDGVASVRIALRDGPTITVPVTNNGYAVDRQGLEGSFDPTDVQWLDAENNPVAHSA